MTKVLENLKELKGTVVIFKGLLQCFHDVGIYKQLGIVCYIIKVSPSSILKHRLFNNVSTNSCRRIITPRDAAETCDYCVSLLQITRRRS